jgi:hypothetical protein
MPISKEITREELLALLAAYDEYIQQANDEDRFEGGWRPVCLNEFYDNEWDDLKSQYDGMGESAIEEYSNRALENIARLEERQKR